MDDTNIEEWVSRELAALDETPRVKMWRHRAVGGTMAQVMAGVERERRIELHIPLAEWRLIRDVAGGQVAPYVRTALLEKLQRDGVGLDQVPGLVKRGR